MCWNIMYYEKYYLNHISCSIKLTINNRRQMNFMWPIIRVCHDSKSWPKELGWFQKSNIILCTYTIKHQEYQLLLRKIWKAWEQNNKAVLNNIYVENISERYLNNKCVKYSRFEKIPFTGVSPRLHVGTTNINTTQNEYYAYLHILYVSIYYLYACI